MPLSRTAGDDRPHDRIAMPASRNTWSTLLLAGALFALSACSQAPAPTPEQTVIDVPANGGQGGALSGGPAQPELPPTDSLEGTQWPEVALESGQATLSCDLSALSIVPAIDAPPAPEQPLAGDELALADLSHETLLAGLSPCRERGVVRLRYEGRIAADFTALVERVSVMARRLGLDRRYLDLDSAGGHVEAAMKAGDVIGGSRWTVRVAPGGHCHSACVLILAAGDHRDIQGMVGVHRMIRVGSSATTREELTDELREVHAQMKDYLERNGAAVAVADLMMTVPNRKLRLLNQTELLEYGLQGPNAIQDDLERIQLSRKCGEDFVRRKDDYDRAYVRQCGGLEADLEAEQSCGLALREDFGFPDESCPVESPLSHLDGDAPRPLPSEQAGQG